MQESSESLVEWGFGDGRKFEKDWGIVFYPYFKPHNHANVIRKTHNHKPTTQPLHSLALLSVQMSLL